MGHIKKYDENWKDIKIILTEKLQKQLINTPETGMGYHKVDLYLKDGEVLRDQIVLNCSILILDTTINENNIEKLVVNENWKETASIMGLTDPKLKYLECLDCGEKNSIQFMVEDDNNPELNMIDHKGRKIKDNGNTGKRIKNLSECELHGCICIGCGDEISGFDVKGVFDDGSEVIGDLEVFEKMKKGLK